MGFFEIAIGDVKMKETRAFNRLWEHSNEMQSLQETLRDRKKHLSAARVTHRKYRELSDKEIESKIQAEVSALTNITEETNLLKEIKDILDELNSILLIFKQQELVVQSMGKHEDAEEFDEDTGELLSPADSPKYRMRSRIQRSHSELLRTIRDHKRDVEMLELEAVRTHDSLSMLLDLKQKQASVLEADYARQETVETTSQGKTLLVFTTVTIIFLPLSFIAGFFSMNAREINGYERPIRQIMAIMIPSTVAVLSIAVAVAYAGKIRHAWAFAGGAPISSTGGLLAGDVLCFLEELFWLICNIPSWILSVAWFVIRWLGSVAASVRNPWVETPGPAYPGIPAYNRIRGRLF
ncbi:hypothetical protein BU26DRAFT_210735 [Trematosphaeria pertusa]|uniref:Uncharacterized protein n=1 Tax=Trematosphaeria pertusa TaxID=390896 RepID=A0A6A6ITE3_9PLEO|nr:uncharacterized protein BU26DRAFT_210735 [Trematosphaeria pertusa]KAF2252850.1 hypothetical protein BU26DRAFT_210735 [Trematosphaeria pertusa]